LAGLPASNTYPDAFSLPRALRRHGDIGRDNAGVTVGNVGEHRDVLPIVRTSMIGREDEIAEIKRTLAIWRIVTLTGTGGVGKTRLALRVAGDLLPRFKDGVRWVDVAPLVDASSLPDAVAQVLGLRGRTGQAVPELLMSTCDPGRYYSLSTTVSASLTRARSSWTTWLARAQAFAC
jgi:NB-ARC domain